MVGTPAAAAAPTNSDLGPFTDAQIASQYSQPNGFISAVSTVTVKRMPYAAFAPYSKLHPIGNYTGRDPNLVVDVVVQTGKINTAAIAGSNSPAIAGHIYTYLLTVLSPSDGRLLEVTVGETGTAPSWFASLPGTPVTATPAAG
jgi:hypothetical protein